MHQQLTTSSVNREQFAGPVSNLYARAFAEHGAGCLGNWTAVARPTAGHARLIARALRADGDSAARELSWMIDDACDASDRSSRQNSKGDLKEPSPGQ